MNITERKVIHCLIRSFDFQIRSIITWAGFFYTSLILLNLSCVIALCVVAMVCGSLFIQVHTPYKYLWL